MADLRPVPNRRWVALLAGSIGGWWAGDVADDHLGPVGGAVVFAALFGLAIVGTIVVSVRRLRGQTSG